jgi:hypothetical protein
VSNDLDGFGCTDLYALGLSAAKVTVISIIVKHWKRSEETSVRPVPVPKEKLSFSVFLDVFP